MQPAPQAIRDGLAETNWGKTGLQEDVLSKSFHRLEQEIMINSIEGLFLIKKNQGSIELVFIRIVNEIAYQVNGVVNFSSRNCRPRVMNDGRYSFV